MGARAGRAAELALLWRWHAVEEVYELMDAIEARDPESKLTLFSKISLPVR